MINVQLKHASFSNNLINDECGLWLQTVAEDSNRNRPDRYWVVTVPDGTQLFTYGTKSAHDSSAMPSNINGIPVEPQFRSGMMTYHGPGQIGILCVVNYSRLYRYGDQINLQNIIDTFCSSVNDEFNETLVSDHEDPGLYRSTGEKIMGFGIDTTGIKWMAIKIYLNLHVDLNVYTDATICGVTNRPMGNLLPSLPDLTTQAQMGENIVRRFWDYLYKDYQVSDWSV
jgi:lipoate-protein ligase B